MDAINCTKYKTHDKIQSHSQFRSISHLHKHSNGITNLYSCNYRIASYVQNHKNCKFFCGPSSLEPTQIDLHVFVSMTVVSEPYHSKPAPFQTHAATNLLKRHRPEYTSGSLYSRKPRLARRDEVAQMNRRIPSYASSL